MKYLKNERGNGLIFMLWIMVVSIAICVIVLNIAKVYIVKQQAATATQQAAIAGTLEYVNAAKKALSAFDDLLVEEDTEDEDILSWTELVDKKAGENESRGQLKEIAYINALNDIFPVIKNVYPDDYLRIMESNLIPIEAEVRNTVEKVILENDGNLKRFKVNLVLPDYRIEVKASVTYESITDSSEEFIESMEKEVRQKGSGPPLPFLKGVISGW
ncbi:hypothetical protein MHZ92_08850 [Sporosarcina sp. ACRSL]|uniref:pilus assembly protein TadG-related protein n=1 Tax=Sporosarcina sp. ACRSL TaxID=2918215 RepID=UPI001EF3EAEF|nr:pilus assembly protein TadG-related protein [Sporosarcina sp. ACRSL]MCG7344240.1 hypothetical protein [Sporosarcina sp. ACRSL]